MIEGVHLMSKLTKIQQTTRDEAKARLLEVVKPGDTVRCILRHVSVSGMSRVIDLIIISSTGEVSHIGYNAAEALGWGYDRKREGVRVAGCGMDMGFHLVYSLAYVLFNDGYALTSRWL